MMLAGARAPVNGRPHARPCPCRARPPCTLPLLLGTDYHALHHSHAPLHRDRNFAGMLPVLDRLFGTHAPLTR